MMKKNIHSILLALLLTLWTSQLFAVTEHQLRVAYLYNITKFIQWPQKSFKSEESPINICIIGKNFSKEDIETLRDKIVSGRKLNIYYYKNSKDIDMCHIAYISSSKKDTFKKSLKDIEGKNIITISDINMFANKGGMIELRRENDKIKLYVNLQALSNENLFLSSKILELSNIVKR
jgi:hypothetical protein